MSRTEIAAALLVSLVIALALGRTDLLPPGPHTDYSEVGEGSDLDIQLEMAWVAARYDGVPWWDPYPDFGQPLVANAEAFVGHPGFLLGKRGGDPQRGVRWMYSVQILVLMLGACWLAVGLGLPWWTGPPLMLPMLASAEWQERLGIGHLMVVGLTAVPAACAGWLAAVSLGGSRRFAAVGLAALGGGAVGLGSLAGGHYPTAFTVFALLLASWSWVAGRWSFALLAVLAVPFGLPAGLAVPSWPGEAAVLAVLAAGLWFGRSRILDGATPLVGFAMGVLATAGWRLVPSFAVVKLNWRAASWRRIEVDPLPWSEFFADGGDRSMEELLRLSPWGLLGLLVGLALLAAPWVERAQAEQLPRVVTPLRPAAALACAVGACVLLGWGAGRPLNAWRVATLAPGMAAINYPIRLQWFLLMVPGFAWAALVGRGVWRASRERVPAWVGPALVSGWLVWACADRVQFSPYPEASPTGAARVGGVTGVLTDGSDQPLSRTSWEGWIRPGFATGIGFGYIASPEFDGSGLASGEQERGEGEGWGGPTGSEVAAAGVLDRWTVRGPPGEIVRVAQRDLLGWRCRGGELVRFANDDALRIATPTRGNNWLRVRLGEEGEAVCRWRPPGLWVGALLQLLALVGLAAAVRRATRAAPR